MYKLTVVTFVICLALPLGLGMRLKQDIGDISATLNALHETLLHVEEDVHDIRVTFVGE